jgi:hypothetical protein
MTEHHYARMCPPQPQCDKCKTSMGFVVEIPRVTKPGKVRVFQCEGCEKMGFVGWLR